MDTREATNCALCCRRIDWSGADHHRAPGSLEDGIVLCRECSYRVEHGEADVTAHLSPAIQHRAASRADAILGSGDVAAAG